MSRHQYVRNLDIDAELDDYDYYDDDEEEMTPQQKQQMREGLKKTREVLGHDIPGVSDQVIEDALWNYYFDVPQTVNYILIKYPRPQQKKQSKAKGNKEAGKANPFAGPSPDDVVAAAQSASKGLNKGTHQKTPAPTIQKTEEVLKNLSLEAAPAAKKVEKIDVLKAYSESSAKENINFVVVGHVDAGKSTLMGRMLYDCGAVDERAMRKYRQESEQIGKGSFALAWVMDQTEEERNRGVTIDIATNHFETPNSSFTILDAPGHRDFIPNMIAGASQADFAVLVIDASTGAFEAGFHRQGQTKEHTLLCRSIGVQRLVVAVNKLDTVDWSPARFEEIVQQMQQFLTNAGFSMKNVTFVPMSGLTGINVVRKPDDNVIPWYNGPSLLEVLETSNKHTRAVDKPLRLVISEVFRGGVTNPVSISGRIDAGYLQEGDVLVSIPSKEQAIAKAIVSNDEPAKWAVAGHNAVIHLSGIDPIHLRPGDVLCNPTSPLIPIKSFNVKLLAFEGMTPMAVDVHKGRLHAAGKVSVLLQTMDKSNGQVIRKKPRHIPPGSLARVTVELIGEAIPVEAGNRIVLRSSGVTVAAGIIE